MQSYLWLHCLLQALLNRRFRAGRFLVGTTLFNVADQQQNNTTQTAIFYNNVGVAQSQTTTPHTIGISSGLNLWAGYFVTKNLLAGLGFASGTASTYTTLFRYYFNHRKPDSAKFDFFLQGNVSFKYTSTDNPSTTQYYPQYNEYSSQTTSDYTNDNTTLAYGLWVGICLPPHKALVFGGFARIRLFQSSAELRGIHYP